MQKTGSMQTALARARGLGSAKSGLQHWWHQRISAAALAVLVIWMVGLAAQLPGADYETARALAAHPANAVALVLFLGIGFWHMALGLQVVLEDYVSHELARMVAILLVRGAALVLAVATILAVLRIMLA